MFHEQRTYYIHRVGSAGELARLLTESTHTTNTAFQYRGLYFLNDSTSDGGAQEYAVVTNGRKIDSLTVSWMDADHCKALVDDLLRTGNDGYDLGPCEIRYFIPVYVEEDGADSVERRVIPASALEDARLAGLLALVDDAEKFAENERVSLGVDWGIGARRIAFDAMRAALRSRLRSRDMGEIVSRKTGGAV